MRFLSILKQTENSFDKKRSYENVILVLHPHQFVLGLKLLSHGIVFIITTSIAIYLSVYFAVSAITNVVWLGYSIFLIYWWATMFYVITMYILDMWVVTDHRIIDSKQHGFFSRTVSEASLARIEDVSVSIRGLIPTMLNYGDVMVQTAAEDNKFIFRQVPDPQGVKDTIMKLAGEYLHDHAGGVETHQEK
jgi:hypothetical protein